MSDYTELKLLAEGAVSSGDHWGRRDSFERQLAKLVGPETVLALIAEHERLAVACERAEQVINAESKAAGIASGRANLLQVERDQLRAEVAGLRTGYEAYERVNAELKAEVGVFRGLLREMRAIGNHAPAELTLRIDAALGKGGRS